MQPIKLDKYESYYLLLLKGWRNPDIEIKDEDLLDRFARSVYWIFLNNDSGKISKDHVYSIITDLAVKCLTPWKLSLAFNEYNPYTWKVHTYTLEECLANELRFGLKNSDVEYDHKLCWDLRSHDNSTFKDFWNSIQNRN